MPELPKAFEPQKYENDIYQRWEQSGLFNPDVCVKKGVTSEKADYFSIVLPPPNVTGTLHMGHAAMLAIEDIMVRYHRMKGERTLWVPGTDHAAVATESKVESKLIKEKGMKKPKAELGREKFLDEVRKFAQESHDTIVDQCKKMGSSLDWSREAYTLDEQRNLAVRTVFKKMFDDGLIYRGYRVVNWSVRGQSTCSDDELVYVERPAKLYFFKYSKDFPITIATTRPETKLGDTAIAVHPDDGRYKKYIGQTIEVKSFAGGPNLQIAVIADESVDMNFGTGAVGVTPAHSKIDEEMAKRAGLKGMKQVIGEDGKMTAEAGIFAGLEIEVAREQVVKNLEKEGLIEKVEDIVQNVGTSDRFSDAVEPLPKLQWFIDVNRKFKTQNTKIIGIKNGQEVSLKELMQTVVRNGQIKIIPDRFEKTYFHWIDNLRDWNISRQIWYGHQVPVWYRQSKVESRKSKDDAEIYVGVIPPEGEGWLQDSDTLDTWFSSGLWTFSTLGWPNETVDLKNFHPTSVLETGYDILFFWIARMVLMTTYALGDVPFKNVYLHGLVRDEQGRKMSKSIGNIIDPLDMIEKYGTDATRLSLVLGTTPGNDLKLSEEKIAGFRNFANKLWNIARFILLSIDNPRLDITAPESKTLADKWILSRLTEAVKQTTDNIEKYNFSLAGEQLRDFTWGELADWYLEIAKVEGNKSEILNYILNTILKLWHPYMPFVTETIWSEIYGEDEILMVEKWPEVASEKYESDNFDTVKELITVIRAWRSENKIEPAKQLSAFIVAGKKEKIILENIEVIKKLARLEKLEIIKNIEKKPGQFAFVAAGMEVVVDVDGAIDLEKEKARLNTELASVQKYLKGLEGKLGNQDFVARAPAAVVEGEKKKLAEARDKMDKLHAQLKSL